ncbi:MAG: class I SAM-dependent methyltransferase, partial [Anaerohalosphaera sp.]|nr:class I SAM-dependent methyltransferase [Anaerohalosphaera sp.]
MPSSSETALLFSSIARRYDFLNHFFSLNMDRQWRRKLVKLAGATDNARVLDLCTGTGDILLGFAGSNDTVSCVGVDISDKMLEIAERKVEKRGFAGRTELICTDAMNIPFADGKFDVVCVGFGLRNLPDAAKGIAEMGRVLK